MRLVDDDEIPNVQPCFLFNREWSLFVLEGFKVQQHSASQMALKICLKV